MAGMDPVAELAESVSELEEEQPAPAGGRPDPAGAPSQGRPMPLNAALTGDLDAELAAELHVSTRRAPRR